MISDLKEETGKTIRGLPAFWWMVWAATVLLSAVTPFLHQRWHVAESIEPLRYPWGLLPTHWLFFRHLGEISGFVFAGAVTCGLIVWFRPTAGRKLIASCALFTLAFTTAYASYCGLLISDFIASETERIEAARQENASEMPIKSSGAHE